ncbi:MAG: hypothetical protein L3J15_07065 [Devosiaceae bacterium]|nr:hypothetical protein [Devosiaceae bacterium]
MNDDEVFENIQMAKASLILSLRQHGIVDKAILRAFEIVPHEAFIPDDYLIHAYRDKTLPLLHSQSISSPTHLADLLVPLEPEGAEKILEIGTGSGYCSALLACMAKRVFTLERIGDLAKIAENNWSKAGTSSVVGFNLDGLLGLGGHQPFCRILLGGSVKEISELLLDQLNDGGILVAAVGEPEERQIITRVERIDDDYLYSEHGLIRLAPLISGKYRNR